GFAPTCWQSHVVAHSSTIVVDPAHVNRALKQHVVGTAVPASAVTQMKPVHPAGSAAGAGDRSSFKSCAWKFAHSALNDQPIVPLQPVTTWISEQPPPGHTLSSA